MNKRFLVVFTALVALAVFAAAAFVYQQKIKAEAPLTVAASETEENSLIRSHSPVLGAVDGAVTIVEFLDPSCEACRAFFPHVEKILEDHPEDVRLVIRYAAFHEGSDEAVRILEASRKQDLYLPVLEALFALQPQWAVHGSPRLDKAWEIAASKGLDVERAKADAQSPEIAAVLSTDTADLQTNKIQQTPTFFVNGKRLMSIGPEQLRRLVEREIQKAKGIETAQTEPAIRKIEAKLICMADNSYIGSEQMPVEIDGKTYYGCSLGSTQNLQMNASLRMAIDPVSNNSVDKATAVIGLSEDGRVYYFENDENLNKFSSEQ